MIFMQKTEFIYGYQTLRHILTVQAKTAGRLYLQKERQDERMRAIAQLAQKNGVPIVWVSGRELDQLLGSRQHQGMALQGARIPALTEAALSDVLEDESKPLLLLILDGIQDPHNLGACIRTANAMGADAVVAPKDRAAGLSDVVHKTACGATAVTPFIQVTNLARTLREIKEYGVWLAGLDAEAPMLLADLKPASRMALVLGGEGEGLRRLTREECDYLVRIPMQGTVTSLNVSVAAAISLYEIRRLSF